MRADTPSPRASSARAMTALAGFGGLYLFALVIFIAFDAYTSDGFAAASAFWRLCG